VSDLRNGCFRRPTNWCSLDGTDSRRRRFLRDDGATVPRRTLATTVKATRTCLQACVTEPNYQRVTSIIYILEARRSSCGRTRRHVERALDTVEVPRVHEHSMPRIKGRLVGRVDANCQNNYFRPPQREGRHAFVQRTHGRLSGGAGPHEVFAFSLFFGAPRKGWQQNRAYTKPRSSTAEIERSRRSGQRLGSDSTNWMDYTFTGECSTCFDAKTEKPERRFRRRPRDTRHRHRRTRRFDGVRGVAHTSGGGLGPGSSWVSLQPR